MPAKSHQYGMTTRWTGNLGSGTSSYRAYSRNFEITGPEKQIVLPASSDPAFRGEASRYNPEELLVASVSSCHMLWYLHLCADAGISVTEYSDEPVGTMIETEDGSGHFASITLRPSVTITQSSKIQQALELHKKAHEMCFIARSVNFPVECNAQVASQDT